MVSSSVITVLIVAVALLAGYNVGKFIFRKDTQSEERRKAFIQLAAILKEYGLKDIPDVLIDLAVKDYSGAYDKAKFYMKLMQQSPEAVVKQFDEIFKRVLDAKLKNPESRALLESLLADAKKVEAPKNAAA
jgi:hypothetical protein